MMEIFILEIAVLILTVLLKLDVLLNAEMEF